MTEDQKRRLNASVIGFVNRESHLRDALMAADVLADAYATAHRDLIQDTGVTSEQLTRMVEYTLQIGYPQDPFLVCEFDLTRYRLTWIDPSFRLEDLKDDPYLSSCLSEVGRIMAGLRLSTEELNAVEKRWECIEKLIQPFIRGVTPKPTTGQAINMLVARYDEAVAKHSPRERWMDELEFLIAPARLVEPGMKTVDALEAALPHRKPVPRR